MGSTSCASSVSNLHFIPNRSHDRRLGSIRSQPAPASSSRRRKSNLLSGLRTRRRLGNDAVDDDLREKELGAGLGSAVEDRPDEEGGNSIYNFLYPDQELLPDDKEMTIFDNLLHGHN